MARWLPVLFLAYMAVSSALLFGIAFLLWLATFWWDRRLRWLHLFSCFWGSLYTWSMPAWPVTIEGRGKIRGDTAYVMLSNHQSLLDILVCFRLFVHFKWVSKAEIFRIPFVGWNMRLNRYISLKRGDRQSASRMLRDCENALRSGSSIFLFPEGTRSPDGYLGPFRMGAFRIALETQAPILPLVIDGTKDALPKKSLGFHGRHPITVRVLDEIPYAAFRDKSAELLAAEVRALLARELERLRAEGAPAAAPE